MQLECLRRRARGTQVELNGKIYDFQPNKAGAHVCEVTDPADLKRLLQIDAYVPYTPGQTAAKPAPEPKSDPAKPTVPEGGAPTLEPKDPEPPADDDQDQDDGDTDDSDTDGDGNDQDDEQEEVNLEDLDDDQLRDEYTRVVGKKPGRLGRDKQIDAIIAKANGAE